MTTASYPLDGPHTPAAVIQAARDVQHLVHYLTRATQQRDLLANPSDGAATIGALSEASTMLFQLFGQLAETADRWALTPGLYDDHDGNPVVTAVDVRIRLRAAADKSLGLIDPLRAAHGACSRLGVQTPKETK